MSTKGLRVARLGAHSGSRIQALKLTGKPRPVLFYSRRGHLAIIVSNYIATSSHSSFNRTSIPTTTTTTTATTTTITTTKTWMTTPEGPWWILVKVVIQKHLRSFVDKIYTLGGSNGFGRQLMFKRSWIRIPGPYTRWTFGHFFTLFSVTRKKSLNVYKSYLKMISLQIW